MLQLLPISDPATLWIAWCRPQETGRRLRQSDRSVPLCAKALGALSAYAKRAAGLSQKNMHLYTDKDILSDINHSFMYLYQSSYFEPLPIGRNTFRDKKNVSSSAICQMRSPIGRPSIWRTLVHSKIHFTRAASTPLITKPLKPRLPS